MNKQEINPKGGSADGESSEPDTGVKNKAEIANGLADVLGDTYVLTIKTHACHWNVEGPQFYSIHKLTEEQYGDLFAAADELAERIRALGHFAPANLKALSDHAKVSESTKNPSARNMVEGLVESHEKISRRLHKLISVSEDGGDAVTADLATQRSAFHEKAAWMLRAMIAG